MSTVIAVDLGATSGRVIAGRIESGVIHHEVVHRFPNGPVTATDGLHWNVSGLFAHVLEGMKRIGSSGEKVASIGVDSWAVDYGLLKDGELLREPFHYRDERTARGVSSVHEVMPFETLFSHNGLQFLPFNTIYQLAAEDWSGVAGDAQSLLLVPDLLNFWLTGQSRLEVTNASTTGLLDIHTGDLSDDLIAVTGASRGLFAPLIQPGEVVGSVASRVSSQVGISAPVVAVGSHDTASAVLATPLSSPESVYISCGTWGLVGLELESPILTEDAMTSNFTNERGVDDRIRFLHNVMGLWLLNESVSHWNSRGDSRTVEDFVNAAASYSGPTPVFDVNDPVFMAPGDMPARISAWLAEHDQPQPADDVGIVASIIESLALAFAQTARRASELAGIRMSDISMVGGGSLNRLLCQRLADHAGVPVIAGPVEATALGNILVQARGAGIVSGDLDALRGLLRGSSSLVSYQPLKEAL
jgi:rhamnulokinase